MDFECINVKVSKDTLDVFCGKIRSFTAQHRFTISADPSLFSQVLFDELDMVFDSITIERDAGEEPCNLIFIEHSDEDTVLFGIRDAMTRVGFAYKRTAHGFLQFEIDPTPPRKRNKTLCTIKTDPDKNSIGIYFDDDTFTMVPRTSILYIAGNPEDCLELHLTNGSVLRVDTHMKANHAVKILYAGDVSSAARRSGTIRVELPETLNVSGSVCVDGDITTHSD